MIWGAEKDNNTPSKKVSIEKGESFDMEFYWSESDNLQFRVHLKPNQKLKYLNKGSAHTPACFKAIVSRVFNRLAKLTSKTDETRGKKINQLYPKHIKALKQADPKTEEYKTLEELHEEREQKEKEKVNKEKKQAEEEINLFLHQIF